MQSDLLFSCNVSKRNTNQQRMLELYPSSLIITKNDTSRISSTTKNKRRMFFLNNLDTKIEWIYNNKKLQGFSVFYCSQKSGKEKSNAYFTDSETLSKLKFFMNGKSIYLNMDYQYQFISSIENKKNKNIFSCRCKITNQIKVAKKIPILKSESEHDLQQQIKILMAINTQPHEYLLKVDELFFEDNHLICIMNYCKGGTLYHYLCHRNFSLDFDTAIRITKKILKGVEHLHSMGIVHRDLKLDNVMLEEENNIKSLKIIDFEYSTFNVARNSLRCGTLGYMAPEILKGEDYCYKCDIYSLGCIFHAVMTGNKLYPTDISSEKLLILNRQNKFKLSSKVFHTKAYETLLQMLKNKTHRPSARELLECELFQDQFKRNEEINHSIKKLEFPQLKNPFQRKI